MNNNDIDDLLKLSSLQEVEIPENINKTIDDTLRKCKKEKSKDVYFRKIITTAAAAMILVAGGVFAYAGATGKLNINIGNTGHQKIDKNYNEVATAVDKRIDNEYFSLTLESMAADPAYLIFEYDIKLKDKLIEEVGEFAYDEFEGYKIWLESDTYINDEIKYTRGRNANSVQKISDKEYRLVEIYNIADIFEKNIKVEKTLNEFAYKKADSQNPLKKDISAKISANIKFESKDYKILAEKELNNGSKLYIEEISNSKFENYVLARFVSEVKPNKEMFNRTNTFMVQDSQFAILDQNGKVINYEVGGYDTYYEKQLENGEFEIVDSVRDDDMIRIQEIKILKLGFNYEDAPDKITLLPVNRKLYSDKNLSEYEFYMQEDWYQVKTGEVNIREENTIGGTVTITKIEEENDKIIFYYDKEGYVSSDIDLVVKVKDKQMNYRYPRAEEIQGIDGIENKIIYLKDGTGSTGMPCVDWPDSLENLEFALFYNTDYDILSDELVFNWEKSESENVAKIENIKFEKIVNYINDKLEGIHGTNWYKGKIIDIKNNEIKFFSEEPYKEYVLQDADQFEYINGRTNKELDFKDIRDGDLFMYRHWGGNYEKGQFVIIRNLNGNELKKELVEQLGSYVGVFHVEFAYRKATSIEVIDDKNAIITYEISDLYQEEIGNDEKFEIKVLVNQDTIIYRSDEWAGEHFSINELNNIEYVPERVMIYLDSSTVEDEKPTASKVDIGWLDEDF